MAARATRPRPARHPRPSWTLLVWLSGGGALSIGAARLSSATPIRPLLITIAAAIAYLTASGLTRARDDAARIWRALTPSRVALLLTIAVALAGITNNSWGAGASDSFSYVSQM